MLVYQRVKAMIRALICATESHRLSGRYLARLNGMIIQHIVEEWNIPSGNLT